MNVVTCICAATFYADIKDSWVHLYSSGRSADRFEQQIGDPERVSSWLSTACFTASSKGLFLR